VVLSAFLCAAMFNFCYGFSIALIIIPLYGQVVRAEVASARSDDAGNDSRRTVLPAQQAADDALQRLMDRVLRVQLLVSSTDRTMPTAGTTVGSFLAASPEAEQALRSAIQAEHRQGRPRRSRQGSVEIDAWLATSDLTHILQKIVAAPPMEVDPSIITIEPTAGPAIFATGCVSDHGSVQPRPTGWRHCSDRQIELAVSAARIDAQRCLFERIAQLRLSDTQSVGHLFARYPTFAQAVRRRIAAVTEHSKPVHEPTGLCRLSLELTRADVVRLLQLAAVDSSEAVDGDFSRALTPGFQDPLMVEGLSVIPPVRRTDDSASSKTWQRTPRPPWADRFATAQATGKAPSDIREEKQRKRLAETAARIEAMRQLWLELETLLFATGQTVGARLVHHPEGETAIDAINNAIFTISAPHLNNDGGVTLTLSIRLETVWRIVRDLSVEP